MARPLKFLRGILAVYLHIVGLRVCLLLRVNTLRGMLTPL